jgi:ABC-type antimicrobial peptide transport system permease subunit
MTINSVELWSKYQVTTNAHLAAETLIIFIKGSVSFFSIIRVVDWKDAEEQTMSAENANFAYTLGALFAVVALASFIELVYSVYSFIQNRVLKSTYIYILAIYAFTQSMLYLLFSCTLVVSHLF